MKAPKLYLTAFLLSTLLVVTATFALASVPATSLTESPTAELGLHFAGHLGGPARAIAVQEPYAYVAFGPELAVLNVSDRNNPRRVGYTLLGSTINALVVRGSHAYVATRDGLYVVSLRSATSPIGVAKLGTSSYRDVVVEGNYAYAVQQTDPYGPAELHIIDITLPVRPRIVRSLQNAGQTLAVADGFVYLTGGGLSAVDVRDPTNPTPVGSPLDLDIESLHDMEIQEGYLYVSGHSYGGVYNYDCLIIVNTAEPAALAVEGSVCTSVTGKSYNNLAVSGQTVYLTGNGIAPIDVSNPQEPTMLDWPRHAGDDLAIAGDYVYAIDEGHGLTILQRQSPSELTKMGSFETIGYAADVAARNGYAYIADRGVGGYTNLYTAGGLKVASGAGLTDFRIVGGNVEIGSLGGITLEGERAYLAGGNVFLRYYSPNGFLRVASIETPETPTLLGSVNLNSDCSPYDIPYAIEVIGDYAYVGYCGTQVIKVSDPHSPTTRVNSLDFTMADLATRGSHAYAATEEGTGLRVLDVSRPEEPEQVDSLPIPGRGIAISDTFAFVAAGEQGLRVLDLSEPEHPAEVGSYDGPGSAQGVALWNVYAFVVEKEGVRVFDVSNPAAPVSLDFYPTPLTEEQGTFAERIVVVDGLVYVADGDGGLFRFRWEPVYSQHLPLVSWP